MPRPSPASSRPCERESAASSPAAASPPAPAPAEGAYWLDGTDQTAPDPSLLWLVERGLIPRAPTERDLPHLELELALATALAQTGLRVALVDADLRRPRQHVVFDVPASQGLTRSLLDARLTGPDADHRMPPVASQPSSPSTSSVGSVVIRGPSSAR